ncbi:hypothetical protein [Emticicia fluvialis]|uniref:hypothetical protein n=1 Tax=Emticicia fluvialis TaxID=2974474 RepID=UPI002166481E|nr:hypothetical protein [Emticicia fluvialis]
MKLKFFIFFFFIFNAAFSQKKLVDGYIILKGTSDTLKGKIDDLDWKYNPVSVNFVSVSTGEKTYKTNELKAFGIYNKEYYEVKTIDLDITPSQLELLLKTPQIIIKKDTTIALMVLVKADHQLSYLADREGKTHFFYQNKSETKELIDHKFLQPVNWDTYFVHNKVYLNQLDTLFRACSKKLKTKSVRYIIEDMVDVFTQFNDCLGCTSTCYVKKTDDKNTVALNLIAGFDLNTVNQNLMEKDTKVFEDKSLQTSLTFGIGASVSSKRSRGSNIFYTELLIKKTDVENKYYQTGFLNFTLSELYRKYFISYSRFKLFGGVGMGLSYRHSTGLKFTDLTAPNGKWYVINYTKMSVDGLVEVGFELNRFQLYNRLRYKFFNPSETHALLLHQNTVSVSRFTNELCISYQFLRKKKSI